VERPELFRHVVRGYGLFGVVTAATLRLSARQQVERVVEMLDIESLVQTLDERIGQGSLYGDFQFAIDPDSPQLMRTGILSCYHPTGELRSIPPRQRRLSQSDWNRLLELAHQDKRRAFEQFAAFYLSTSGQLYWSDTHQLNLYLENYHGALDERLGSSMHGGEMITEVYVPRARLAVFMQDVRRDFLARKVDLIYGTIRLIEPDRSRILRILALLYVAGMAVRLVLIVRRYGSDYYLHGAIPVAFHWVLALFVLVWTRLTYGRSSATSSSTSALPQVLPDMSSQ
jgi:hypothetical protein